MTRRRVLAVSLGLTAVLATAVRPAAAESAVWTLVASPPATTTGVSTTFVLTATNEDPLAAALSSAEIGCVVVDVPSTFTVAAASVIGSSMNGSWAAAVSGNRVQVQTSSGGDRLALLDWVRFTIRATALGAAQFSWPARAFRSQGCTGTGALLGVAPIVVVTGPALTPAPVSTPVPVSTPAPVPSVAPVVTPVPVPVQPPSGISTPLPTAAVPGASPDAGGPVAPGRETAPVASATADPSGSPPGSPPGSASPAVVDGSSPAAERMPGGPAPGPAGPAMIPTLEDPASRPVELALGPLGLLGGLDVWTVPGLVFGVPGVLIALFALLQAIGAMAWLPAIRRLRG